MGRHAELVYLESQTLASGHVLRGSHPDSWRGIWAKGSCNFCSYQSSKYSLDLRGYPVLRQLEWSQTVSLKIESLRHMNVGNIFV